MKVFYMRRGEGKTRKIIELAVKNKAYIIVTDRRRAQSVYEMAVKMGFPGMLFPVTVSEYMSNKMRGSYVKNVLLDDADDILQHIFSTVRINAISLTDPGEEGDA